MLKPFFSIIVPAYNVADFIEDCVNSALKQPFSDFELIVVDDGSTDQTPALLQTFSDPRLTIHHQTNSGLSVARNSGIALAKGKYLILLDGDDFLAPNALSKISSALSAHPVDVLRFQAQDFHSPTHIVAHPEPSFDPQPGPQAFLLLARSHYVENAWLYCYRTAFFRAHRFAYPPHLLGEDFALTPLILATAPSVAAISDICYNYRQRSGSIVHNPNKLRTRIADAFIGLELELPPVAALPGTAPILHFLLTSFLTSATTLDYPTFHTYYQKCRNAGYLAYLRPASLRAYPRTLLLKISPRLFYRFFGQH